MSMKAVRIHSHGGNEVLKYETCEVPQVGVDEVLVKNETIGVNFIDTYHRSGLYPVKLPFVLGREGCGVVEEVGKDVTVLKKGDRVVYGPTCSGSYAEYTTAPIKNVTKVAEGISNEDAVCSMVSGLTAHYLVKGSYYVKKGDYVLVHAVAGALGQLVCQMAKHLGAFVIGTTSTLEKANIAKKCGCDEVILYKEKDFVQEVKRITNGKGCQVVYDSVGKDTFEKSLDCLGLRGFLISCGNASGPPPKIDPLVLSQKGSLTLNRPSLAHYIATREEFLERSNEVFEWRKAGFIKFGIFDTLPLQDAAKALEMLESRKTIGKLLLKP